MSSAALELNQVIRAVQRSFPLMDFTLPDEFYPAHLSIALIDAVFRSRGKHNDGTVPAAERYCCRFGVARIRTSPWNQPSLEDQETLTNLIGRFDELGMDRMTREVFRTDQLPPDENFVRAESVLGAAGELRRVGIEVLQDVQALPSEEIERTLVECAGFGKADTRRLLMYAGNDDFVRGDDRVRRFVAGALGEKAVSAAEAERLVRCCAYELVLSPRYLDHQISRYRSSGSMVSNGRSAGRVRTTDEKTAWPGI